MARNDTNERDGTAGNRTPAPTDDGQRTDHPDDQHRDPGAYVGREPERQAATIPGGISDADERVAAHSTQSGATAEDRVPDGHGEGSPADDDQVREAGQSR
jgi:hypothetical protein